MAADVERPGPDPRAGALVLVGTPIGNLDDLSGRAVRALATADVVCCEDTRRTGRLLAHAGIGPRPLLVVNDHTEPEAVRRVLDRLATGAVVALVSDAGMPAVSDPGALLVSAVLAAGHPVSVVPGPSASLAALVISGLPTGRFVFEGFLPRRGPARRARLASLAVEERTAVIYEAPHRLARTLGELGESCGPRREVAVARELTKLHEEVWRGRLGDAAAWAGERAPRGEMVVILAGAEPAEAADPETVRAAVADELAAGATARDAAAAVAAALGVSRRDAYSEALRIRSGR